MEKYDKIVHFPMPKTKYDCFLLKILFKLKYFSDEKKDVDKMNIIVYKENGYNYNEIKKFLSSINFKESFILSNKDLNSIHLDDKNIVANQDNLLKIYGLLILTT